MNLTPIQISELAPVNLIVYHTPHIIETLGYIHPLASLFEKSPNFVKSAAAYECLVTIFKRYNIHYAEVTDVLKRDKQVIIPEYF
jgi:hypothetical protein